MTNTSPWLLELSHGGSGGGSSTGAGGSAAGAGGSCGYFLGDGCFLGDQGAVVQGVGAWKVAVAKGYVRATQRACVYCLACLKAAASLASVVTFSSPRKFSWQMVTSR